MIKGICSLIYPVKNVAEAKKLYEKMLGTKPNYDDGFYVGFQVGGNENDFTYQEIGLIQSDEAGSGPTPNLRVQDIAETLKALLDAGATLREDVHNVSEDMLMASVTDQDGNVIGLVQFPPSKT